MIKVSHIVFYILLSLEVFGQEEIETDTIRSDWKKILMYHHFEITKQKENIPSNILKIIDINNVSEIANPNEKWDSSCNNFIKIPNQKLNWVAYIEDKLAWIVSITSGSNSIYTKYYLIVINDNKYFELKEIRKKGKRNQNFRKFKKKYINDTFF